MKISVLPCTAEFTRPDQDSAGSPLPRLPLVEVFPGRNRRLSVMLRFSPKTIIGRSSMNLDGEIARIGGGRDVQQRRFAADRHGVRNRAELKRKVHSQVALRRDQDRFPDDGAESLLLNDQAVGPDRKVGCQVVPEFVGLRNRACCSSRC